MEVRTLAIAQPTFLPWAGWYDLVDQADFLVLLDDVAFSKQSWQQRNRIRTSEGLSYLTVPVLSAGRLGQRICDTKIAGEAFVRKMLRTVAQNYRRAEFFERYYPEFCAVFEKSAAGGSLSDLNCRLIEWLASALGITTPSVRSSQLDVGGKRGAHVAMLCEQLGARRYISPPGAEDYLLEDRSEFDRRSISVEIHVYEHPVYRQCFEPFEPYASALDLVFNEGDRAGDILRSGRRPGRGLQTGRTRVLKSLEAATNPRNFPPAGGFASMSVAFRVDASSQIGTGQFFRCLTLADALTSSGRQVCFVSRQLPDELQQRLSERNIEFRKIGGAGSAEECHDLRHSQWLGTSQAQDAAETIQALSGIPFEWLIVDHYALDERWETALRAHVGSIAVIDDLADRSHNCDVLLDQNLRADNPYAGRVPVGCKVLLGPTYALVREEFRQARPHVRPRHGSVKRILIYFGGVDAGNFTGHAIEAVAGQKLAELRVDVIADLANQRREQIASQCTRHGFAFHVQTDRMGELMAAADLSIGAGGAATWERCCLGLPTLVICAAENQKRQIEYAACDGLLFAPEPRGESTAFIRYHVQLLMDNPYLREAMSRAGLKAVDGEGVWRAVRNLTRGNIELRVATVADADSLFSWRNDPAVRAASRVPDLIDRATHQSWLASVVNSADRILLIGECGGQPVGVIRFDLRADEAEISIYLVPGPNPPGQGRSLLHCAERWLAANHPAVSGIRARVLAGNERSARLFLGAGYVIELAEYSKRIIRR